MIQVKDFSWFNSPTEPHSVAAVLVGTELTQTTEVDYAGSRNFFL
jgi:hypothetical protein